MFIHNLDPVLLNFGYFEVRWYSLAYIAGIFIGWKFGKKILGRQIELRKIDFKIDKFDDLISYIIIGIILGGRLGYVIFYNFNYYFSNPLDIVKIWEGGMSFHGALIGVILATILFSKKYNFSALFLLDIIASVTPIGLFFGRIANFINSELYGKITDVPWAVIFPLIDTSPRHPSQIYESLLEGLLLFIILNIALLNKRNFTGLCSVLFLFFYGIFRIIAEQFRVPDAQLGYLISSISMGTLLSIIMILGSIIIFFKLIKNHDVAK
ncbi:MAG: prolipoprotein diacylglyceryl transferase [Candidatus Pelagibacter sp. TMED165]|nr:MAG: prolipoprotein diacylglyceryl transferase [Candidatus Pelagibacter sp. TMED165]|tara:strand:- start:633 stop:1433 length:801 start_codon:yes stop_codon:yes gene_type:complete